MRARLGGRVLLAAAAAALALAGADRALAWTGRDMARVAAVMVVQKADPGAYRVSRDPVLHYELSPGDPAPGIHVNAWGARGPEREAHPPPGTLRVLWFGASSIFGARVRDEQAVPARLEAALAERLDLPVEVWNFGHSGYAPAQTARRARLALDAVPEVDLVLLTHTNANLRPFLDPAGTDPAVLRQLIDADPVGWLELMPRAPRLPGLDQDLSLRLHWFLLRHSAAWRLWRASLAAAVPREPDSRWASFVATRESEALCVALEAHGVRGLVVQWPERADRPEGCELPTLSLDRPGLGPEDKDVHPSPEVLDAHARWLAGELLRAGWVGAAG